MSISFSFFILFNIILLFVSFSLLLNSHFFNSAEASNQSILNLYLSNKTVIPETEQTITVKFNNISNQQDYLNVTTINGNIIYLSNVAQVFTGNITNNEEYSYSWIVDPNIQDSGIVLVKVDLFFNGSKIQSNTTSFNIVNIK